MEYLMLGDEFYRRCFFSSGSEDALSERSTETTGILNDPESETTPIFDELRGKLAQLQKVLYAQGKHKILIVIQAMDTGGKDGCVRKVFSRVDPQGIKVTSYKGPSEKELAHDFLWRIHQNVPARGEIAIFNRSHYEDIVAVRVKGLAPQEVWEKRYKHIIDFEQMLVDEGTTILKFFLNISKEEQRKRLQSRLDRTEKQWKFHPDDLADRARWEDFMEAYEDVLARTSTPAAPWFVIPADFKWYRNMCVSQILTHVLDGLNLEYPQVRWDPSKVVVE